MMTTTILTEIEPDHADFLRDESRMAGTASSISFPQCAEDVRETLAMMSERKTPVTVQGARTGIAGGAVPEGGHILNLSRMTRICGLRHDAERDCFLVTVEPGVVLADLREALESKEFDTAAWSEQSLAALTKFRDAGDWFLPPDPTETSASIGGMVAANASGARTFRYGSTRTYVESLRVVTADGSVLDLARGREKASGRMFSLKTDTGREIAGALPSYEMPQVKNAAGCFVADDMDMVDLFIGAEGVLGVVTQIELRLVREPSAQLGVTAFFPSEDAAVKFVHAIRKADASPVAVEFFDRCALNLLRRQKAGNPAFGELPEIDRRYDTAIYVEFHADNEDAVGEAVMAMSELMVQCGGDEDATWIADGPRELERLKLFRHAVPEAVNLLIDARRRDAPELTKLGTDMAVPDERLDEVLALYRSRLEENGLEHVMFGHIGNNHVHVNVLPRSMDEYRKGKDLYEEWADAVAAMGGTVSAEHGIGKLKKALLKKMYGEKAIAEMRDLKKLFDPNGILNRGNLF
jgi:D-lactate dehydrogenase (cytochrome)